MILLLNLNLTLKAKIILAVIFIAMLLIIGFVFGAKTAAGGGLGILGLLFGAKKKLEKEAEEIEGEQESLQNEADNIEKESANRVDQAERLNQSGKNREEKAEKLNQELKGTDNTFIKFLKKFTKNNKLSIFLVLLFGASILINSAGIVEFDNTAIAAEITDTPKISSENSQLNFNKDNFRDAKTLDEANEMIDTLLNFTVHYRRMAYEYKGLYEDENKDKANYKELYEAERADNQKLQIIIDNQGELNDKLQDIIKVLLNSQDGGLGLYGGLDIKPGNLKNSGVEAGISFEF